MSNKNIDFAFLNIVFAKSMIFDRLCDMVNTNKQGDVIEMKKTFFYALSNVSAVFLTLVVFSIANSSGCYLFYQPKMPKSLDKFKILK